MTSRKLNVAMMGSPRGIKCFIITLGTLSSLYTGSSANVFYSPDEKFTARMGQLETMMLNRLDERMDSFERRLEQKLGQQFTAMQKATDIKWLKLNDKFTEMKNVIAQNSGAYFTSCRTVPSEFSNVFMIRPPGINTQPFLAYCEQDFLGGGWIVIHKRFDGSLNFTRSWVEYREGFGDPDGEHWMGLDKIHKITRSGDYELLVQLKDFDGTGKLALYDGFQVDGEGAKYKLRFGQFVHGNAENSLDPSNGARFSTFDQDNDQHGEGSCADFYESGWWFKNCMNANLNGLYQRYDKSNKTMNWFGFRNDLQGLKEASMMIREKVKV
ncbi:angiopoietin-related protein 6-like [Topomyia yanbarensis]|uniref:angiopoietin-related protein 6-like n=1 Tax=Topomyia yanbarensis TaxID=2498891 RepID=UPI00273B087C|nr:angiopoietin-related protein 6-like [Topomyia yanbarensis]